MYDCFKITSLEELASYRGEWQDLLSRTPHASFFQSSDWLGVRWQHGAPDEDHFVIGVRTGAEVLGFLPLMISPLKTSLGEMQVARFPIDGWASFYGPVSAEPKKTLDIAIDYLFKSKKRFDFLELSTLRDPEGTCPHVGLDEDRTTLKLLGQDCSEATRVGMLHLSGNWVSYWESRRKQKNRRRNVERCERRLCELGEVRWERYRPASSADRDSIEYVAGTCSMDANRSPVRVGRKIWLTGTPCITKRSIRS